MCDGGGINCANVGFLQNLWRWHDHREFGCGAGIVGCHRDPRSVPVPRKDDFGGFVVKLSIFAGHIETAKGRRLCTDQKGEE